MEDFYKGSRDLDQRTNGIWYLIEEGIVEGTAGMYWNRREEKPEKPSGNIAEWKWSVMERIANFLYWNGPTTTETITRLFGVITYQYMTTMTYYWPVYEEDKISHSSPSLIIGIRTEPHILEHFAQKRRKAREAQKVS